MFKKLRIQILKLLFDAKMKIAMTEDDNRICISATECFQHSDHSKHYRTIFITMTEEVR